MATDWALIRDLMAAVIETTEAIEATGHGEGDRERTVRLGGNVVTLHDIMASAQTLPEDLRYRIIRARHEQGMDAPYVPEAARMMVRMVEACGEPVGAAAARPADGYAHWAIDWYRQKAVPSIPMCWPQRRPMTAPPDGAASIAGRRRRYSTLKPCVPSRSSCATRPNSQSR